MSYKSGYVTSPWYPSRRKKRATKAEILAAKRAETTAQLRRELAAESAARHERLVAEMQAERSVPDERRQRRLAGHRQFVTTGDRA